MYSRPTCHLCDVARHAIQSLGGAFEFDEISVEGDETLERDYGLRVPVVLVDGEEAFETVVDRTELRRLLSDA